MSSQHGNDYSIDRFIEGRLTSDELEAFLRNINTDSALRSELERLSGPEAAAGTAAWEGGEDAGLAIDEATWHHVVDDSHWQAIVDQAVDRGCPEVIRMSGVQRRNNRPAMWMAAAACIALGFGVLGYVRGRARVLPTGPTPTVSTPIDSSRVAEAPAVIMEYPRKPAPAPRSILVPRSAPGVIQLSGSSGVFAETGARLTVTEQSDSVAMVCLLVGNALFSVEKGRYRSFEVIAPHAKISVVGTIFTVAASETSAVVSVIEGRVRVEAHGRVIELTPEGAANTLAVDPDSLVLTMIGESATLRSRTALLHTYVEYLGKSGAGELALLRDDSSMTQAERDAVAATLADNTVTGRSAGAVFDAAAHAEAAARPSEALRLFRKAAAMDPASPLAPVALYRGACILTDRLDRADEALSLVRGALATARGALLREPLLGLAVACAVQTPAVDDDVEQLRWYLAEFPHAAHSDEAAFQTGQLLRTAKSDYASALKFYQMVVDSFAASSHREDALHWAGWCAAQVGAENFGKRFFSAYDSSYPEGVWRDAIVNQ